MTTTTANPAADTGWPNTPPTLAGEEPLMSGPARTRRAVLKGAAAVTLTAGTAGVALAAATETDPVLAAIAEWERAWLTAWSESAEWRAFGEKSPEFEAAYNAHDAAHNAVCLTVATTAAGLAAQLRFAYDVFSDDQDTEAPGYRKDEPYSEPAAYEFGNWTNGRDGVLLASLLEAARQLAAQEGSA